MGIMLFAESCEFTIFTTSASGNAQQPRTPGNRTPYSKWEGSVNRNRRLMQSLSFDDSTKEQEFLGRKEFVVGSNDFEKCYERS